MASEMILAFPPDSGEIARQVLLAVREHEVSETANIFGEQELQAIADAHGWKLRDVALEMVRLHEAEFVSGKAIQGLLDRTPVLKGCRLTVRGAQALSGDYPK